MRRRPHARSWTANERRYTNRRRSAGDFCRVSIYASWATRCTIPTLESTATSVCVCGSQCCRVQSEAEQLQYAGLRDLLVVGLPCRVCNLSLTPAPPRQTRRTYIYYFTTTAEYHSEIEKLRNLHPCHSLWALVRRRRARL